MTTGVTLIKRKIYPSLLLLCILLVPGSTHDRNHKGGPMFDVPLPNLTIKQGSDASFTCVVKHLGEFKVAWIRSEDKKILAWHTHMVANSNRFRVTHNGHNTWTLHIRNVQQNDSGTYLCQINTDPQRSQYGTLLVVVPADIIDAETSGDVIVNEDQPATLRCKARGYPQPKVRWKRQDGQPLPIRKNLLSNPNEKVYSWEGETLPLRNLQRTDTGPYLCIANNSVPPLVSKRVMVYVHFNPLIKSKEQLVAAPLGYNITLECYVESVPRPVCSWFTKEGQVILNSLGRMWQETESLNDYAFKMKLTIANLKREDFTDYNCSVGNSLGSAHAIIKLQQLYPPPTPKPTTTSTQMNIWRYLNNNYQPSEEQSEVGGSVHSTKHSKNHRKKPRTKQGHFYDREKGNHDGGEAKEFTTASSSGRNPNEKTMGRDNSNSRRRDELDFMYGNNNNGNSHTRTITTVRSDASTSVGRVNVMIIISIIIMNFFLNFGFHFVSRRI